MRVKAPEFEMSDDEVKASLTSHMRLDMTCQVQGDWWDACFHAGVHWARTGEYIQPPTQAQQDRSKNE